MVGWGPGFRIDILEASDNFPDPDIIAQEIVEDSSTGRGEMNVQPQLSSLRLTSAHVLSFSAYPSAAFCNNLPKNKILLVLGVSSYCHF